MDSLFPSSKEKRIDQYDQAWSCLLNPSRNSDDRLHSKCWLTYRAIDGEIKYEDWLDKIANVSAEASPRWKTRWLVSINTAAYFLCVLNDDQARASSFRQEMREGVTTSDLIQNPGSIQRFIMVESIESLTRFEAGRIEEATTVAERAIMNWRTVMGAFDLYEYPYRFAEMQADGPVLHHLTTMIRDCGIFDKSKMPELEWTTTLMNMYKEKPWGKCIKKIKSL